MRKQSMMGSSKYEFNPEQFDKDIQNKIDKHQHLKQTVRDNLIPILHSNPGNISDTFSTILEVLREIKQEYKL